MDEYTVNELYKVKTSPNAHKIFKILDDRKSDYRHSFKKYTKSVQDYIVKNRQVILNKLWGKGNLGLFF